MALSEAALEKRRAYRREWYAKNKEKALSYQEKYYEKKAREEEKKNTQTLSIDKFNDFYMIPRTFFIKQPYKDLPIEAKLLYGIILNRLLIAAGKSQVDENGKIAVPFSEKEIAKIIGCSEEEVKEYIGLLDTETGIGLIDRKYAPSRVYIAN